MELADPRRHAPRIPTDGICGVVSGRALRPAAMLDLSWMGLRLELPFDPAASSRTLQLEIELPGLDEIVWARGRVTFARLTPMGGQHADGQPRMWCKAGVLIDLAAASERRLIRDFVIESQRAQAAASVDPTS